MRRLLGNTVTIGSKTATLSGDFQMLFQAKIRIIIQTDVTVTVGAFSLDSISLFPLLSTIRHHSQEREQQGKIGKDFVARLSELKSAVAKDPNHENHQGLTEKIITAQGTIFFVAGFETTSNTLSTLCYRFGKSLTTLHIGNMVQKLLTILVNAFHYIGPQLGPQED